MEGVLAVSIERNSDRPLFNSSGSGTKFPIHSQLTFHKIVILGVLSLEPSQSSIRVVVTIKQVFSVEKLKKRQRYKTVYIVFCEQVKEILIP